MRPARIFPGSSTDANKGKKTEYLADAKPDGAGLTIREMDCMDCHNRPAHVTICRSGPSIRRWYGHQISAALPFAKKMSLEILKVNYASRDEAALRIPAAFAKFYQESYPAIWAQRRSRRGRRAGRAVLAIYNRNIFPEMKVTWGKYPINIGHTDFPGCFRCHDGGHNVRR